MANPQVVNGSVTLDGETLVDAVEVNFNNEYETLTAEMAFGETAAPQDLGPERIGGTLRFRYTGGEAARIRDIYAAKQAVTLVVTPVSGSGADKVFSVSIKLSSYPVQFKAGGIAMASCNFVGASGAALSITPNLTLNVASIGSVATGGDGGTFTDLVASGGTATYTYAVQSGVLPAGLSLSSGGVWSGTLTNAVVGTHTFVVRVTDSAATPVVKDFALTATITS